MKTRANDHYMLLTAIWGSNLPKEEGFQYCIYYAHDYAWEYKANWLIFSSRPIYTSQLQTLTDMTIEA